MFTIIYKLLLNNLAQMVAANEERARRVRLTRETRNTAMRPRAKNPAASRCQLLPLSTRARHPSAWLWLVAHSTFFGPFAEIGKRKRRTPETETVRLKLQAKPNGEKPLTKRRREAFKPE